jgi:acetyl coenzyme A synthetase (ADP forming)-like protein
VSNIPYPTDREADVVLRDGSTVHVRPVKPADEPRLLAFLRSLSHESRALRFFSAGADLEAFARDQSHVDYADVFGLIATTGVDARIVGHAMYARLDGEHAEVALANADAYQGQGLGTLMLGQLAEVAAAHGIRVFEAEVLPHNHRMLSMFRNSGFPVEVRVEPSELHVIFPTSLTDEALEHFERREQLAAANALATVLQPRSVAVIGASRQRGTVGGELFHNLLAGEFAGPVYPVNPSAAVVQSVAAYPHVDAIPGPVDLAVIAVPAAQVCAVAEQCASKGVRALVVISAGFAEVGAEGRARQAELLRVCRAAGMRMVGPNCFGVLNTDPTLRLNATFGPHVPPAGRVALASQSGALALAIIDRATELGIGLSSVVSTGDKADISGNDLLMYWADDPRTDVILLYLESFGNPRKFARLARQVGREKPIVVVKSGRSAAGARATASHTGALLAASDVTVEALFRQAGVIRTDTLSELFDVTMLLSKQPPPRGRRLGIVTNVGGPAILCVDTAEAEGLETPLLSDATQARLRAFLAPEASVENPVDMLAAATADEYRQAMALVAQDPHIDAVVAIFLQPLAGRDSDVEAAIAAAAAVVNGQKPVIAVLMSSGAGLDASSVPVFRSPEAAAIAVARAARYGAWRARDVPPAVRPDGIQRDAAAAIVAEALGSDGGWLPPDVVTALLACYGLPLVEQRIAGTPVEAGQAAAALGGPVALKVIAPGVLHKTEAGAVRLGLVGAAATQRAAEAMSATLAGQGQTPSGFVVQRMAPDGVELLVGVAHDPQFGPVIACGAGGVMVELLKDVSVRLAPLSAHDAAEMLRDLKTYPLLSGFRGSTPRDTHAVEDLLLRVGALADDLPDIAEVDCNPVIVHEHGATIVDARVRVERAAAPLPLGARRR